MSKKLIIGIAAGVAVCVVAGLLAKKNGALDGLLEKIKDLANAVDDKYSNPEKFGMDDTIPKGEDTNVAKSPSSN